MNDFKYFETLCRTDIRKGIEELITLVENKENVKDYHTKFIILSGNLSSVNNDLLLGFISSDNRDVKEARIRNSVQVYLSELKPILFDTAVQKTDREIIEEILIIIKKSATKTEIFQRFDSHEEKLKDSMLVLLEQMDENQAKMVTVMYKEIPNLTIGEATSIEKDMEKCLLSLNVLKTEIQAIKPLLQKSDLNTKLKLIIPLFPFLEIEKEFSLDNPIYKFITKCKAMIS